MSELTDQMRDGRPVDVDTILGWQYRGTSLGLPSWIERLTWKSFIKVFHRDDAGTHRGWNVRCHQEDGRPKVKRSVQVTFGHFAIVECPDDYAMPDGALLLDYGAYGMNATSALRDPLVALDDCGDTLLGCSFVSIAGRRVATPSFFRLERLRRVVHVTYPPRG